MKTGNRPNNPRCALAALMPADTDTNKLKEEAWHEHRLLVIHPNDWRLTKQEAEIISAIGARIYGGR